MTTTETDWPYDADRDDPLTKLRIPVTTLYPDWKYLVAFNGRPIYDGDLMDRPDEQETAILASYIQYTRQHWFNERWQARLLERPFDIDGGHNTLILRKWGPGDWAHRRASWQFGPSIVPCHPQLRKGETWDGRVLPLGLVELLDCIHAHGGDRPLPAWLEWKAAHPDVFPAVGDA